MWPLTGATIRTWLDGKPGKGPQVPTPSYVCLNDGKGHFPACRPLPTESATSIVAADFDGDGRPDLAIIDERLRAAFTIFNHGGRQFGEPVKLPGPERPPYCLAIADLNRDKRPDIVVGYVKLKGSVYFNTGRGSAFHEVSWNDGKGTVYGLAFADFNGDGWPDIAAARSDAPNAIWFSTPYR